MRIDSLFVGVLAAPHLAMSSAIIASDTANAVGSTPDSQIMK
jgi:hypothetical protein